MPSPKDHCQVTTLRQLVVAGHDRKASCGEGGSGRRSDGIVQSDPPLTLVPIQDGLNS